MNIGKNMASSPAPLTLNAALVEGNPAFDALDARTKERLARLAAAFFDSTSLTEAALLAAITPDGKTLKPASHATTLNRLASDLDKFCKSANLYLRLERSATGDRKSVV